MLNQIELSRTDLNLLVLFEVVLKHRHVGRAAQQLNISASAVSHGLRRLRRMLNDPLFLRTPKGVVPTARAMELAEPIGDILARARSVVAGAKRFEPDTSTRRFIIGSPDGVTAVFLPPLLVSLHRLAPRVDIGMRELLPIATARSAAQAWERTLVDLDARAMDVAVLPIRDVPPRFSARVLFKDDFVIAVRDGHPFAAKPSLERFCALPHLLVSLTGDAFGFVDQALARQGLSRRVALTVPNFMMALAMVAETDLLAALPRQVAARHARRFRVRSVAPPIALPGFEICSIAPKVALLDEAVAWLVDRLQEAAQPKGRAIEGRRADNPRSRAAASPSASRRSKRDRASSLT